MCFELQVILIDLCLFSFQIPSFKNCIHSSCIYIVRIVRFTICLLGLFCTIGLQFIICIQLTSICIQHLQLPIRIQCLVNISKMNDSIKVIRMLFTSKSRVSNVFNIHTHKINPFFLTESFWSIIFRQIFSFELFFCKIKNHILWIVTKKMYHHKKKSFHRKNKKN